VGGMTTSFLRRLPHRAERAALLLGIGCLMWALASWAQAAIYQFHARNHLELAPTAAPASGAAREPDPGVPTGPADPLIGLLEIPRLAVSAAVLEGDDDRTLRVAVGHLPDTALPWEDGNMAFAGHRDTFFRPSNRSAWATSCAWRLGTASSSTACDASLSWIPRTSGCSIPPNTWA
jgi:hypothetical protein